MELLGIDRFIGAKYRQFIILCVIIIMKYGLFKNLKDHDMY